MATLQQLAEAHRLSQTRLAAALVQLVARAYRGALAPDRIDRTAFDAWLAEMIPLILSYRGLSEARARSYLSRVGVPVVDPDPASVEAIETSLNVTGWAELLAQLERDVPPQQALERATILAQGAADRHALNGGRSMTLRSLQAGTDFGYYRITREGCCYFCAALASRGAVYGRDSFSDSDPRFIGDGDVKVHDHCHCTYGKVERDGQVPQRTEELRDLWDRTARQARDGDVPPGLSRDPMNVFRRAYESEYLRG